MTQPENESIANNNPRDLSATPAIEPAAEPEKISLPVAVDAAALAETASKMPPLSPADLAVAAAKRTQRSERAGPLPIGTVLGHFVVERYIGGGGMGRVYLAHDNALDRKVAIKVLPKQRAHDAATVARFMNEARSAARLNHEHIAQVYFAHEYQGTPYIAFEYVEGVNMRDVVNQQGAFTIPQALNYAIQITYALNHIYAHGVVHRDVKPSNILITPLGKAKLIDMGLARLLNTAPGQNDLTASGVTLGTFDYISPEQARDPRGADIRSDIYSLGCTIFFMLTGRPPFPEGTVLQKLLQHQGDEPPNLHEFIPDISPEVMHLTQKMMAKDPRQRYQNPQALLQSLAHAAEGMGLRPASGGQSAWVERSPTKQVWWRRHLAWFVPALLLFVSFIALTIRDRQIPANTPSIKSINSPRKVSPLNPPLVTLTPPRVDYSRVDYSPLRHKIIQTPADDLLSGSVFPWKLSPGWSRITATGGVTFERVQADFSFIAAAGGGFIERRVWNTTTTAPQVTHRTAPAPTFIVDPLGAIAGAYKSLPAALSAAPDGSTIELRFNGVMELAPFTIPAKHLRIVAGTYLSDPKIGSTGNNTTDYFTPVLVFAANDSGLTAMMTLEGGDLTFENIAFELIIPATPAPCWSLMEIVEPTTVAWQRCVITVRNLQGKHRDVAVVRSANSILPTRDANPEIPPVSLKWENSILRGETSWLVWNSPRGVRLEAENCLVALEATPFVLAATTQLATASNQGVNVDLRFVTLVTADALWQATQKSLKTSLIPQSMQLSGCVMIFANAPLIKITTEAETVDVQSLIPALGQWTAGKFPNFFSGVATWLKLRTPNRSEIISRAASAQYIPFSLETQSNVLESTFADDKKFYTMRPTDVSLQPSVNNPALKIDAARNAGVNEAALPVLNSPFTTYSSSENGW